jgi:NAD(P)-dependent dehydrogenase (short-subunit alcohol dehydrogenase family)
VKPQGVALVTGAARGLGRAVALQLALAGFDVVASMRQPERGARLEEELAALAAEVARSSVGAAPTPGSLTAAALDVDDPSSIDLPAGLRVLVNNAGIERSYLPVEAAPMDEWREVFETNVFGLVEVTRRAVPLLRANGGGVICNVTSSSLVVSAPFYAVYRASKAAVQAIGESLRAEVGGFGIRVVEVMPGPVATDMLALSARVPEAATVEGYEALADAWHQGRLSVEDQVTPVADAARAVVAAIVSDDTALRWGCDDLGGQLVAAWQRDPESTLGGR